MEVTCLTLLLVLKEIKKEDIMREVVVGKIATHLRLILIVKALKIGVE